MENLAQAFDQPIESREHQVLASSAWLGGELVTVRYWLGRLLGHNFFREPDDMVKEALRNYLVERGCERGSRLATDCQSWRPLAILLQDQVERREGCTPTQNRRLVAAIAAVLAEPGSTNSELALVAKTTEKQIARMSDVCVLQHVWKASG